MGDSIQSNSVPVVGVVIPTHNRIGTLPAALASVLGQSYTDFEVLIVDDASTDATPEFLQSVTDPRVRYLRLNRSHGAGGARNEGVRMMLNPWIAFQDSDDTWYSDKLRRQMQVADQIQPDAGVIYCRCRRTSNRRSFIYPPVHAPVLSGSIFDALLAGNLISTQTAVVRRACFVQGGGFDEALPPLEDWELFLRLSRHVTVGFVDEVLVDAPLSPDSISACDDDFIRAYLSILGKYADDYRHRPDLLAKHYGTIADRMYRADRWREGRDLFRRGSELHPHHAGHAIARWLGYCPPAYRFVRRLRQYAGW